jgi:EAL domain-containing protein (putative c-di-GMP-specific phosphodiesterase class I)
MTMIPGMGRLPLRGAAGEDEFPLALVNGVPGVTLAFQAIVALNSGGASGYEVLVRAQGAQATPPDRLFAAASEFVPGGRLEGAVWRAAFEARDRLASAAFLSVNASPDFLASEECEALMATRASLKGIVIEVTEHEAITDYDRLSVTLSHYRSRGAAVALDNAGAAYASLSHILALRPEYVKLDRAFVSECDRDVAKAALVEMMNAFAGRSGSLLTAEGVETENELAALANMGVPLGQGSFVSPPQPDCCLPSQAVTSFLRRNARLRLER